MVHGEVYDADGVASAPGRSLPAAAARPLHMHPLLGAGRTRGAESRGVAGRHDQAVAAVLVGRRTLLSRKVDGIIVTGRRTDPRPPVAPLLPVPAVYVMTQSEDPDDLSLREAGRGIPDDIALVGYDNWDVFAAAGRPPLTTVDMCLEELGGPARGSR